MHKKITHYAIIKMSLLPISIMAISNKITYPDTGVFSKDAPGYNTSFDDPRFHGVQPILFTPEEDVVTGDDTNKDQYGYFWDIKDSDNDQQFTGKARIGNSQYIDVVAVDAQNISTTGDANDLTSTDQQDLYKTNPAEKKKFNPQYLVKIGTFMKKNNPTVYVLFGRYLSTIMPDPRQTETT